VCPGCGHQSDKLEPFLFVSLPIPTSATSTSPSGHEKAASPAALAVYVIVVRDRQPAVRHGFQLAASRRSTVAKLRRLIKDRTGIPHRKVSIHIHYFCNLSDLDGRVYVYVCIWLG